ncbi:hypothetical protein Tco_0723998 [Tanacetum coccineum]
MTMTGQYTKKIKEQEDLIDTMSDQLAEEKNIVKIKQTTISELKECLRKKDFENEYLKSKVAHALAEAILRERDEMINAQCNKIRMLEEQSEIFHEVPSEFDSEKVHDTQDSSEKDLILSLQTQLTKTAELVV